MKRIKALGLATVVAAVSFPLGIVVAGGSGGAAADEIQRQTVAWTGTQQARKQWKPVPGVELGQGNVVDSPDLVALTVSVQMTKGAAKFRIRRGGGGAIDPPGAVRFGGKAASSFTWALQDTCGPGDFRVLEWKRAGKSKAVAAKLTTHAVWNGFCL